MSLNFSAMWSIYAQCSHKNKLLKVHLPAIENAVGKPGNGWVIEKEEHAPSQFRVIAQFLMRAPSKDEAAIVLIKNAYALFNGPWSISGLTTLNHDGPLYMVAGVNIETPQHLPPAITSVMLEVEQR